MKRLALVLAIFMLFSTWSFGQSEDDPRTWATSPDPGEAARHNVTSTRSIWVDNITGIHYRNDAGTWRIIGGPRNCIADPPTGACVPRDMCVDDTSDLIWYCKATVWTKYADAGSGLDAADIDTFLKLDTIVADEVLISVDSIDTFLKLDTIVADEVLISVDSIDTLTELNDIIGDATLVDRSLVLEVLDMNDEAELETQIGSLNVILDTEIDSSSKLSAIVGDASGTGVFMLATNPTMIDGRVNLTTQTIGTGGQGNGVCAATICVYTVDSTNNDMTLPAAVQGRVVWMINASGVNGDLYPALGDDAGAGVNTLLSAPLSRMHVCVGIDSTFWWCQNLTRDTS